MYLYYIYIYVNQQNQIHITYNIQLIGLFKPHSSTILFFIRKIKLMFVEILINTLYVVTYFVLNDISVTLITIL